MLYLWVKYIHILSSTILFGTGLGTASILIYGHYKRNIPAMVIINQYVVTADWVFTGSSGFVQLASGLLLVYLAGLPLSSFWIMGGLIGYIFAALCWFVVVCLQIKLKNLCNKAFLEGTELPKEYSYYFKWWFILGWPAFTSLVIVFYLMVMKPY